MTAGAGPIKKESGLRNQESEESGIAGLDS
jgi:hypothetical protein